MEKYWITFLLGSLDEIKNIKNKIDSEDWRFTNYTEGVIPRVHLSVEFVVKDEDDIESLKDACDDIMIEYDTIYCIVYGMDILEYYDWERNELMNL